MHSILPFLLIGIALLGLLGVLAWRSKKAKSGGPVSVATSNHHSVRSFQYGPPPVLEPPAAAPPLPAGNVLEQLMPEEDFRAKEATEAAAAQAAVERLAASAPPETAAAPAVPTVAAVVVGAEAMGVATGTEAAAAAAADAVPVPAPVLAPSDVAQIPVAPPVAVLLEPTPAPAVAAAVASVVDMLGADELPAAAAPAPDPADDALPPALLYNPLTAAVPTANDEANRLTAAELRKRRRAAIQANAGDQKAALAALYSGK